MTNRGRGGGLKPSARVQYLYPILGIPRMSNTFTGAFDVIPNPAPPLNASNPLAALVWFYDGGIADYRLQEYRARMIIDIPDNLVIDKIRLYIKSGPIYSSKTISGGIPSDAVYMQPDGLKLFLGDVDTNVPFTYAPLATDYITDPIIQTPLTALTDVTNDVLGSANWNPEDGQYIRSIEGDLTNLLKPGDHKILEFREATGSSTVASGGTLLAYAVLEGFAF